MPARRSNSQHEITVDLLETRAQALFRELPGALAGYEEPLHQMRVAGRRLRVALRLLARKPEGRRARRAVLLARELTRVAGQGRDLDVSVGLLDGLTHEAPSAEVRLLRRRLRASRSRSRRSTAGKLFDIEIARLRRGLARFAARGGAGLFVALSRLRQTRDDEGAALLREVGGLGERYEPAALHALRRRCRRLRYAAELGEALLGRESEAPALLKSLQDDLGRLHDAWLLAGWLSRQAAAAERAGRATLAAEARRLERAALDQSGEHHARYLGRGPAAVLRRALDEMGAARTAA